MAGKTDFKKDRKEFAYRRRILEALLVSSLSEKNYMFPTIEEFILSEVVNGTIEYAGGNAGQIDYQLFRLRENSFEREIGDYLDSEMKSGAGTKLSPKVKAAIAKLCECYYENPEGPERPYACTELYHHFKGFGAGGICPAIMRSSFSLPHHMIVRVQADVLASLPDQEIEDIEGIGKAMRKHIELDLEFIRKTYHW